MRQWNVEPRLLCRQHLLGEHVELHMLVGTIVKNKSIAGYIRDGLVQTDTMKDRHEQLVREMQRRGYNHKSPLPPFTIEAMGFVDGKANLIELAKRCNECRKLQKQNVD